MLWLRVVAVALSIAGRSRDLASVAARCRWLLRR